MRDHDPSPRPGREPDAGPGHAADIAPAEAIIRARGLTRRFGTKTAVDHIDVEVPAGRCWGLLGPNGAGKTTFLRMVAGAIPPSAGELRVLGHEIPADATLMRRRIGIVPQKDNLDPDFTVAENLRTYATYFGLRGERVEARIHELLAFAGLEARAGSRIETLSGGMQRRLSLVRALINEPRLVILDEPTTGLDPQARQIIWQRLRSLRRDGITLVITTHYMEEAARLCDSVTIMDAGRILDAGAPEVLIRRHIEPRVVEVHGDGVDPWHRQASPGLWRRHEHVGGTYFYYADDDRPLLAALEGIAGISALTRPTSLEDVFLKLTGNELRDE